MSVKEHGLVVVSLVLVGCFSPRVSEETDTAEQPSATETSSTGDPSTTSDPVTPTATDATSTTGASTDESSTETTEAPDDTTADQTSATNDETETGGQDPFCGDGVVDDGEECDDGLRNNGLDQSCLPDCNLNVCGDGNVGPDEACDEGEDDNLLEPGACAPDCSTVIGTREIVISDFAIAQEDGNFGPNPLATADAMCPSGYDALLAVPGERQATNTPNQADALVDWPISPYTAYVNADGEGVWITDDVPLLGVRDGVPLGLTNAVTDPAGFGGPFAVTGLNQDWTTNTAENCNNFSSSSSALDMRYGTASSDDLFLSGVAATPCNDAAAQVLCVEQ